MTKDETINGLQEIIDRNKNSLLPRVHIGYLIHAVKYLKEQEPVEPRIQTGSGVSWWYICGKCNAALNPKDVYCSRCGRKVKWDG